MAAEESVDNELHVTLSGLNNNYLVSLGITGGSWINKSYLNKLVFFFKKERKNRIPEMATKN
ncbi:hypothetical protein SDJN02_05346 [Cucurbita argyrosperma subsp. argyrosperma]|nr:hypothetical protein SDJN02_05346 [Cucurbita argyrosperma subsp. argyrosperma]